MFSFIQVRCVFFGSVGRFFIKLYGTCHKYAKSTVPNQYLDKYADRPIYL